MGRRSKKAVNLPGAAHTTTPTTKPKSKQEQADFTFKRRLGNPAPSLATITSGTHGEPSQDATLRRSKELMHNDASCFYTSPYTLPTLTSDALKQQQSHLAPLPSSYSITGSSTVTARAAAAAGRAAFEKGRRPPPTSGRGALLALLERSTRQLWRRKIDFLVELLVPLVFVAISMVLWAMWGSSHSDETFYDNYQAAELYGTQALPPEYSDETAMCFVTLDDSTRPPIGTFHQCTNNAAVTGYSCDADMTYLPLHGVKLCITEKLRWDQLAMYTTRRYLGYLSQLPTLDVVIKMQWIALAAGEPIRQMAAASLGGIRRNTRYSSVLSSGSLYFVGPAKTTEYLLAHLANVSALFPYVNDGVAYNTVDDALAAAAGDRTWAIVELRQMDDSGLDLVLHMNNSALPSFATTYDPTYAGGAEYDSVELYVVSGFLTLQKLISDFYLSSHANINVSQPFYIGSFPTTTYTRVPLLVNARQAVPLIFAMAFLYSVSQQAKRIVVEKELRIREAMLIMGLKHWAVYVSEFIVQFPLNVLTCIIITVMLRLTYVTKSDPLILFLVFFLFSLTTIPLSGIIAAFFSRAHLVSLVSPVVYVILVIPMFAMTNASGGSIIGVSLLSPSGFAAALNVLLMYEAGSGCGGKEINNSRDNPTMAAILGMLTADFFIYYLLMLYLDAVMPKEWGTPKHPLFFIIDPINWCFHRKHKRLEGGPDGRAENGVFETTEYVDDVVSFDGLRKEYSRGGKKFVAVNNLYWGMKEGEISVLLGHNGAGKTTVLNMMTGMTEPDEGDCYIYGHSVRTEKNAVRQLLGYCPQHNILWSELTCRDHLEFYAKIKGLKGWELEDAVCRMLYETDLLDKMDQPSHALSGGMKRRLSIAIAFVGGSRLVFLDEPTAGLDVAARRHVWELLKRMAQSRTLLLTTHYMDEADLLGSRIGIMSQGRLKCSGSSLFLKSRLGVGYSIVISVDPEIDPTGVDEVVLGAVEGAKVLSHNGCELSYQLPTTSVDQFPALLNEIDSVDADGIRGYSLAATTLEEVFLKVSEEDIEGRGLDAVSPDMELIWMSEVTSSVLWSQFKAMLSKRLWCALRDQRMQCFQIVCPVLCILIAMLLNLVHFGNPSSLEMSFDMFPHESPSVVITSFCDEMWGTVVDLPHARVNETHLRCMEDQSRWLMDTWYLHEEPRFGSFSCIDVKLYYDVYAADGQTGPNMNIMLYNTSSRHQAAINLATYYDLFLKHWTNSNSSFMKTTAALLSKPSSTSQLSFIFIGALIMIPFTFLPSNPVAWIVKERQCGSRHLQNLCGLNFFVYWGANFLFDMVAYFIVMLLCILIFACFNRHEFIGSDRVGGTFVLFIVYGFTSTAMAYTLSFLFKEHSTAQTVVMGVSFVAGFLLLMIVYVLTLQDSTVDTSDKMRWGFRVVPSYCIGEGLINLLMLSSKINMGMAHGVWDMDQLGWAMVYLAAEFPAFIIITLLADHPAVKQLRQRLAYKEDAEPIIPSDEDSDVEDEREAVYAAESDAEDATDVVRVVNLQKKYSNGNVAVKGITFSIFPGEVFGFLGTNGAGKTTTISMLCQQFLPTGGSAYICGYDVVKESHEALKCVGYCPQFDGTLDLLTVEEQLQLYAGIRGIERSQWGALVDALCTLCELTMYRKTVTGELSGGNRRKLSVAMSLVGGPQVLFLDEPSAGMDPVARRGMWTAIQRAAKHCSVVLTTHHLEEVEALADIVAIMVRGHIRCIGDKVHLKNKFGSAFEVNVRLSSIKHADQFVAFMKAEFPDASMNEGDGRRFVYRLPRDRQFGDIFEVFQGNKKELHITDYSVSQTSIEQIFLQVRGRAEEQDV